MDDTCFVKFEDWQTSDIFTSVNGDRNIMRIVKYLDENIKYFS